MKNSSDYDPKFIGSFGKSVKQKRADAARELLLNYKGEKPEVAQQEEKEQEEKPEVAQQEEKSEIVQQREEEQEEKSDEESGSESEQDEESSRESEQSDECMFALELDNAANTQDGYNNIAIPMSGISFFGFSV